MTMHYDCRKWHPKIQEIIGKKLYGVGSKKYARESFDIFITKKLTEKEEMALGKLLGERSYFFTDVNRWGDSTVKGAAQVPR